MASITANYNSSVSASTQAAFNNVLSALNSSGAISSNITVSVTANAPNATASLGSGEAYGSHNQTIYINQNYNFDGTESTLDGTILHELTHTLYPDAAGPNTPHDLEYYVDELNLADRAGLTVDQSENTRISQILQSLGFSSDDIQNMLSTWTSSGVPSITTAPDGSTITVTPNTGGNDIPVSIVGRNANGQVISDGELQSDDTFVTTTYDSSGAETSQSVTSADGNQTVTTGYSSGIEVYSEMFATDSSGANTISISGQGAEINTSDVTVYLEADSTANVIGNSNTVLAGTGSWFGVYGESNQIAFDGPAAIYVTGTNGDDDTITGSGDNAGTTVVDNQTDWIVVDANAHATIVGDDDTVDTGNGATVGFEGGNENIYIASGTVNLDTSSTSVTVWGDNDNAYGADGSTIGFYGGTADNAIVSNSSLYVDTSSTSVTVWGNNDTVNAGNGGTVGFEGGVQNIYTTNATVNLDTSGTAVTVWGDNDNAYGVDGARIGFNGGTADNAFISNSIIDVDTGSTSVTVYGDNDNVNGADGATVGFQGGNENVYIASGTVNLDTSSTSVTVWGDSDNVNGADGSTVGFYGGTGDNAFVSNSSVYVDTSSTSVTAYGNSDTINAGNGGTVGVSGDSDTVNISGGTVNFDGNGTSMTVNGSENAVYVDASNETVYAGYDGIYVASGLSNVTIIAGDSSLYEGSDDNGITFEGSYSTVYEGSDDSTTITGSYDGFDANSSDFTDFDGNYYDGGESSGTTGSGGSSFSSGVAAGVARHMNVVAQYDLSHGFKADAAAAEEGVLNNV